MALVRTPETTTVPKGDTVQRLVLSESFSSQRELTTTWDMSERTPLLDESQSPTQSRPEDIYDRFTQAQKRFITSLISIAGIIGRKCSNFDKLELQLYLPNSLRITLLYTLRTRNC